MAFCLFEKLKIENNLFYQNKLFTCKKAYIGVKYTYITNTLGGIVKNEICNR